MVYRVLSFTLALLLLLVGCAGNPPAPASPAAVQKEAKPQPATEGQKGPSQAAQPAKPSAGPSGTLVSAVSNFGEDSMDPMLAGISNYQALLYGMYEQLVSDDSKGRVVPTLAESWSVDPDGKTWRFKIRKGVKFHNGDEFTAADAKFSLERLLSQKSKAAIAPVLRPVIDRIETPDPYTLVIVTKEVVAILPDLLTGGGLMMPKRYIEEKGEAYFADHPIGTGPWRFVKREPGASVEFEAVKDHWRVTPAFQTLIIKLVPEESTRVAMLKRGEVDVAEISLDNVDAVKAAGLEIRKSPFETQAVLFLAGTWVQTDEPKPTMDLRVRQALSLAIDREELAKTFFKGYGTPGVRLKTAPYSFGWDPTWKADPYDPQKAKSLLAEAGYPGKFKDPVINLWSYQLPGAGWMPQLIQIISGYWEAVGVKTKVTPIDFATVRSMYVARPQDPKLIGTVYPFNLPAQSNPLMSIVNDYGSKGINQNLQDATWDELYAKTLAELDANKRIDLFRQLMNRGHSHYTVLMTVSLQRLYGVSNKIGVWNTFGTDLSNFYEGMQHR